MNTREILNALDLKEEEQGTWIGSTGYDSDSKSVTSYSPVDGSPIGTVSCTTISDSNKIISDAHEAFIQWRLIPGPKRGELVRIYSNLLREYKTALGRLITLEVGKIKSEAEGEVQEMIDICDYALGQSRQLCGLTMTSERSKHRLMEQWHPLGVVGVISAFNFPMAVWAWNAMIAIVCGNSIVWKPSEKAPFSSIACHKLFLKACEIYRKQTGISPGNISNITTGGKELGIALTEHVLVPLVSATGSTAMGREVAVSVSRRFGRHLLELGGNNAMIVTESADLELATRAITFAAVGTAGQRCTTLRRLIVHKNVKQKLFEKLKRTYTTVTIGSPFNSETLVGPLIDENAAKKYDAALSQSIAEGGIVTNGGRADVQIGAGVYVKPALVEIHKDASIIREETFAPILYIIEYETLEEAIQIHNGVPQGLSGAIFTSNMKEAEIFLSPIGSDCGIANVNIGTSGAEIGGAFGGEKETGGGRECGSDSWKAYMRRATNTINYSDDLPLAQGVIFI